MKRMRKKGTYLQHGSRCSAAWLPGPPTPATLGLAACTTLCGLTSQFTETPGLGEGAPSPSQAGGLGRKTRPADPSHGQGASSHCPGLLTHSLRVCTSLSLPMHSPQDQQPQPLTALEKGAPSRMEEGEARGPSSEKKKRGGGEHTHTHARASSHNTPFGSHRHSSPSPPSPHRPPHPLSPLLPFHFPCTPLLLPSPAFRGNGLLAQARENWQEACLCKDSLTF